MKIDIINEWRITMIFWRKIFDKNSIKFRKVYRKIEKHWNNNNSLQVLTSNQKSKDKWIIVVKWRILFHYTNIRAGINNKFIRIKCGVLVSRRVNRRLLSRIRFSLIPSRTRNCTNQLFPNSGDKKSGRNAVDRFSVSPIRSWERKRKKELKMKRGEKRKRTRSQCISQFQLQLYIIKFLNAITLDN